MTEQSPAAPKTSYVPKNILLTGGAGFIGSHVVQRLCKHEEYKIVVLDKLDYCANLKNLDSVKDKKNFKFVKGDISSFDFVAYLLLNEQIDTILHFAAQTHVDNSFGNSFEFTKNNIFGTHVLLETARVAGTIKRFLHVSTDEVYGEASHENKAASFEFATLEPTNPYSASKAGAEMLVKAYFTSYKLPCIISRGNNVYGPHQYPEKLIPKFTLLAKKGMKLPVHGDGSALRSYLYVSDVAAAFEVLLHRGEVGEVYNIGTTKEFSTLDVARDICAALHVDANGLVLNVQDRLFNDRRYFIESTKLQELGWRPEVPWNVGLKKTIDWYVDNVFGKDYWADYEHALVAHPHVQKYTLCRQ